MQSTRSRWVLSRFIIATVLILTILAYGDTAYAGVKIKFIIVNRSDESRTVPVVYSLPEPIRPGDIIDSGPLEIKFDPKNTTYFASGNVTFEARESRIFEIEVKDVWTISSVDLKRHIDYSLYLAYALRDTDFGHTAKFLARAIANRALSISDSQAKGLSINQRIKHFKKNRKRLVQIEQDIRLMKNFTSEVNMVTRGMGGRSILTKGR